MMTGSELFTTAHKIARETRDFFVTYRAAFSAALKGLYAMMKNESNPFQSAYDLAAELDAANAVAREIGHRIHLTGKGSAEMMAAMQALDALNGRRCEMISSLCSEYRPRKRWTDEAAHEAYTRLWDASPISELECYC
jgi:hypothetical protein